jgi:hypothetical protein
VSYLDLPRIGFAGQFEADVNTVNNDVRNFDAEVFEPRFQTSQKTLPDGNTEYNGWWNPNGSNRFSLIGCAVTGVAGPGSIAATDIRTWTLQAQVDRTAAKIVDLDPQFQMGSGLWGLRVALMDGDVCLLQGSFVPASFRDIFFGRLSDAAGKPVGGSGGASARFTGALEDLRWSEDVPARPVLQALKTAADANQGRLMLSIVTYGYVTVRAGSAAQHSGTVIGSIGPWRTGEPLTFAPGRRFSIAADSPNAPVASAANIGFFTASTSGDRGLLSLDFGVSLPLQRADDGSIRPLDLGPLTIAVAKEADTVTQGPGGLSVVPGIVEGQALAPDTFEAIGVVLDYATTEWLHRTGGVIDLPVPAAAQALIADHPLLVLAGSGQVLTVAIRESYGGFWARADNFVQRLDAAPSGWVSSDVDIWAMRWGAPWAGAPLAFTMQPIQGQGGTDDPNEVRPPQTVIPDNNLPLDKVRLPPTAQGGADGKVKLTYWAADPGNPRGYIDGQIYQFNYAPVVAGGSPTPPVELIAVHVRDAFVPPAIPNWENDVKPVLVQYGNLYPVMSRGLFSFSDFNTVAANARLLHLAFTVPIDDPNYMPATRDLSAGKMRMIVDWLRSFLPVGASAGYGALPPLPVGVPLPASAAAAQAAPAVPAGPLVSRAVASALEGGNDGKTAAMRNFLKNAARGANVRESR